MSFGYTSDDGYIDLANVVGTEASIGSLPDPLSSFFFPRSLFKSLDIVAKGLIIRMLSKKVIVKGFYILGGMILGIDL